MEATAMSDTTDQKNPLVSVIVPVFNEASLLHRCIDSILRQTYKHLEIIIVDDGSTDGSSALCDDLEHTDDRLKVIHQANAGLSAARNTGIAHAHGEFVSFIDSDDYIDDGYIAAMVTAATKSGDIDLVITDFQTDNPKFAHPSSRPENTVSGQEALITAEQSSDQLAFIVAWDKLYRASLFDRVLFPVGKVHEDEFTYYRFLFYSRKVSWINSPGYHYCFNQNGITGQEGSSFSLDTLEAYVDKCLFYLDNEALRNTLAPLAIKQYQWYFLLKVSQKWHPQNDDERMHYQSIQRQIDSHRRDILSVLSPLRKTFFILATRTPRLAARLYFGMKESVNPTHSAKPRTKTKNK